MFSEILPYLEVNQGNQDELEIKEEVITPDVLGKTLDEASNILKEQGLEIVINSEIEEMNTSEIIVKEQTPQAGITVYKGSKVYVDYE